MKIDHFDIHVVEIPMRHTISHTLAERSSARNILVSATSPDGVTGWGECCPRPYVTGETIESAHEDLKETILPQLLQLDAESPDQLRSTLLQDLDNLRRNQHAAFCAAELAVLDLWGHLENSTTGDLIGPVVTPEVRYSGVIATGDPENVASMSEKLVAMGFREVKIKTAQDLQKNRDILQAARSVLGDDVSLRIDANCAWDADEAIRQLRDLEEFNIQGVEQPLPASDIEGLAKLVSADLAPVVVDESLCSLEDAQLLIKAGACNVFNIRISKNGGLLNAKRLHDLASDNGLSCQLGAQVGETGILSAAGRHYATRCGGVVWAEGSFGAILLENDIVTPDVAFGQGGVAAPLTAPGLGVVPDDSLLKGYTLTTIRVGP